MPSKLPRCKVGRCKKIARHLGFCRTHATKRADKIFSLMIREGGRCYGTKAFWSGPLIQCGGYLSCCHLFSRKYRNVRWDARNAVPMCGAHHSWFDQNPIEKDDMILEWLGLDYEMLRLQALSNEDWRIRMEAVLRGEE